jgi:opacity protein-like surface antigen
MSRKSMLLAAAALAASLAGAPAAAQNSGWYIGGGPGMTRADFERGDFTSLATGSYSVDDDEVAPRVFGGYRVTPNWGFEFGFTAFGRFKHVFQTGSSAAVYEYDASALTTALVARLPLGGGVSVNGRGGIAFTAANLRLAVDNGTATPRFCSDAWWYSDCTSTDTNLFWGVGLQFDISPRWGIRLDYDDYGTIGDQFESGRADIEQVSINVLFNF